MLPLIIRLHYTYAETRATKVKRHIIMMKMRVSQMENDSFVFLLSSQSRVIVNGLFVEKYIIEIS